MSDCEVEAMMRGGESMRVWEGGDRAATGERAGRISIESESESESESERSGIREMSVERVVVKICGERSGPGRRIVCLSLGARRTGARSPVSPTGPIVRSRGGLPHRMHFTAAPVRVLLCIRTIYSRRPTPPLPSSSRARPPAMRLRTRVLGPLVLLDEERPAGVGRAHLACPLDVARLAERGVKESVQGSGGVQKMRWVSVVLTMSALGSRRARLTIWPVAERGGSLRARRTSSGPAMPPRARSLLGAAVASE